MWILSMADLRFRARQFMVAVVGSALVFAMALIMQGLATGFHAEAQRTVAATNAQDFVVAANSGGPFTSVRPFPQAVATEVAKTAGVRRAAPMVVVPTVITHAGRPVNVHLIGYQPGALGAPAVRTGRPAVARGEAVVDALAKIPVGAAFTVGGQTFHVVGAVSGLSYQAGIANVYVTLPAAQALVFGGQREITTVAVEGRPRSLPAGFASESARQTQQDMLRPLSNAITAVGNARLFLWLVAAVIIGVVVYLSALERRRDFAVLKAIGFSSGRLFGGLALQATAVAMAAVAVAALCYRALVPLIPIPLSLPVSAFGVLPAVAVVVGLLASVSGLRQTLRVDPALAFGAR